MPAQARSRAAKTSRLNPDGTSADHQGRQLHERPRLHPACPRSRDRRRHPAQRGPGQQRRQRRHPGFQPSDVDFHAALEGAIDSGTGAIDSVEFSPEQGPPIALRADGNGVDAEAESAKLAENGLELSARVQIVRTAMGVS